MYPCQKRPTDFARVRILGTSLWLIVSRLQLSHSPPAPFLTQRPTPAPPKVSPVVSSIVTALEQARKSSTETPVLQF
ncbi:hypothetical protein BDW72DRAFT_179120 [Aspergillus terricola var. indicus]